MNDYFEIVLLLQFFQNFEIDVDRHGGSFFNVLRMSALKNVLNKIQSDFTFFFEVLCNDIFEQKQQILLDNRSHQREK
jgi:hypothetical protein